MESEEAAVKKFHKSDFKIRSHSINYVSSDYESLDYDYYESELTIREEKLNGYKTVVASNVVRWLIYFSIAVCIAAIGIMIDIIIEYLCNWKYQSVRRCIDKEDSLTRCIINWIFFTIVPTTIGSCVVLFMEPSTAGSGIPFVIAYLNGIRISRMTAVRCLLVKIISVICVCVAGLGGGKEGPLINIGAMVGGSVVEAWWKGFKKMSGEKIIGPLQNDRERRDMMAAGAAAGLSAAFGSPVGGTLMSLEEGTSFWSSSLMWKVFFCAAVAFPTCNAGKKLLLDNNINITESLYSQSSYFFGNFNETTLTFSYSEFPIFIAFGTFGGILGSLFVTINNRLSIYRMKHIVSNRKKLLECILTTIVASVVSFLSITILNCHPKTEKSVSRVVQMNCPVGTYNEISPFWLHTQEENVRILFHSQIDEFSVTSLFFYSIIYFLLTVYTVGLNMSAGLFLPLLLIGAAWGRIAGIVIHYYVPDVVGLNPAKYALLGAAATLSGVARITISLTVVLIEATGNLQFLIPLMITLFSAKWTGDYFSEGIYEMQMKLSGFPMLVSEPPPITGDITAEDFMNNKIIAIPQIIMIGTLIDILNTSKHNGFPVVTPNICFCNRVNAREHKCYGLLKGLILRSQLNVILKNNLYLTPLHDENYCKKLELIRKYTYKCHKSDPFQKINIEDNERSIVIDLRPYMNVAPYIIRLETSLPRTFRLFRTLGLRHIVVINNTNEVVGMVTRKDLARFRLWRKAATMGLKEINLHFFE
ncbi:H(+)/Cl(-) exchange transporter 7-like isoform X1 [Daktulosphaira vitifoliae]|uniref:H(+)/Cl(-) exchange transporter 7-like isoform X1 n=2 Tax=Daktulosphaira vitifoliae TaxID=58002 RepID=UPI0021AA5B7F|nr:H(+)/Cl(-) exchange transporter 7-like isoform X1 [Daktulosphaira vitifoliae]